MTDPWWPVVNYIVDGTRNNGYNSEALVDRTLTLDAKFSNQVIFGKLQFYMSVRYFMKSTLRTDSLVALWWLASFIMDYKD